jgi:hypothetical protein
MNLLQTGAYFDLSLGHFSVIGIDMVGLASVCGNADTIDLKWVGLVDFIGLDSVASQ